MCDEKVKVLLEELASLLGFEFRYEDDGSFLVVCNNIYKFLLELRRFLGG